MNFNYLLVPPNSWTFLRYCNGYKLRACNYDRMQSNLFFFCSKILWRVVEKLTTRLFILTHISLVVFFNVQNVLCRIKKSVKKEKMKKAKKNIAENKEKNPLLPIHPTVSAKCPVPLQCAKGGNHFWRSISNLILVCNSRTEVAQYCVTVGSVQEC